MKNWKEDIKKLIRLSMTADSLLYMKIRVFIEIRVWLLKNNPTKILDIIF